MGEGDAAATTAAAYNAAANKQPATRWSTERSAVRWRWRTCSFIGVEYMTWGVGEGDAADTTAAAWMAMNMVRLKARVKVEDLTMGTMDIFRAA